MKLRKRRLCALTAFCIIALICACAAPMQKLESDVGYGWETIWSDIPPPGQDTAATAAAREAVASEAAKIAAIYNASAADTAKSSSVQETVPVDTAKTSAAKTVPVDTAKTSSAKTLPVDTAKTSSAKTVPADTAKTSSAKTLPADTAKTSSAKKVPVDTAKIPSPKTVPPALRPIPVVSDSAKAAFEARFVKASRDTLLAMIRSDYALCAGDTSKVSNEQLMSWRVRTDAQVMKDAAYPQMFRDYVKATGIKAQDVRPCEPIAYAERKERERRELDSAFTARRAARDKELSDSISAFKELASLKPGPADILGLPEGLSMSSIQTILYYKNIKTRPVQKYLQVNKVDFKGLTVNVAFYFSDHGKYIGYEVETEALRGDRLNATVREWAAQLTRAYEGMLGPPNSTNHVGFREIRQGRLSITATWEKTPKGPRTLIGLATNEHLYYAKVMVAY